MGVFACCLVFCCFLCFAVFGFLLFWWLRGLFLYGSVYINKQVFLVKGIGIMVSRIGFDVVDCFLGEHVPDRLAGDKEFCEVMDLVADLVGDYEENWIDPQSDSYGEAMHEVEELAVDDIRDQMVKLLLDAEHRAMMFGEEPSLIDLVWKVRMLEVDR